MGKTHGTILLAKMAVLTLADIKAALDAFNCGDTNAVAAAEAITDIVTAYQAASKTHRDAA